MILSPYGPAFPLINHNQTKANVKLQWASPAKSQHNPKMLRKTVSELNDIASAQLAMELVALRHIEAGEELFLDYGDEWEAAWTKHVETWEPVQGADSYVSAFEMNQQVDHVLRTEFEQMTDPYPANLMIKFQEHFEDDEFRSGWLQNNTSPVRDKFHFTWMLDYSIECEILNRLLVDRRTLYTIVIMEDEVFSLLENVPQEAIFFADRPYSSDVFLPNAFRYEMRIPDELFPEQWKNLKTSKG